MLTPFAHRRPRFDRRGGPALEFALVSPVLIIMIMGVYDLSWAIITLRRLTAGAQEVAEAASTFSASTTAQGISTTTQANQAMSIANALFPQWGQPSAPSYGITLSSVAIVASPANCTTACTYTAQTAWSMAINGGLPVLRPCGTLNYVADTTATSLNTIPVDLLYPPSILVADLSTIYTPTFASFLTGPVTMNRSAYMPPRGLGTATYVQLKIDSAYNGTKCPGFP